MDAFDISAEGRTCADLGANVGGFTDCLLQRGAVRVFAVDTARGILAWKLRSDNRVVTLERSNALYLDPRSVPGFEACSLVTLDLGWTPQRLAIPAALNWLEGGSGDQARIISLVKPHYEKSDRERREGSAGEASSETVDSPPNRKGGSYGRTPGQGVILSKEEAEAVVREALEPHRDWGVRLLGLCHSPIQGGGGRSRTANHEWLALFAPG